MFNFNNFFCLFNSQGEPDSCFADGSRVSQYESQMEHSCETLFMCIVSMLRDGVRSGGSIGDSIRRVSSTVSSGSLSLLLPPTPLSVSSISILPCSHLQESLFILRVIYDLSFFFFVIVILIIIQNLIFGVIIDTFADLRAEKNDKEDKLYNSCFICGLQNDLDLAVHVHTWQTFIVCKVLQLLVS